MSLRDIRRVGSCLVPLTLLQALSLAPGAVAGAVETAPVAVAASEWVPITREVRLPGTVTSPRAAELSTQVAGQVVKLGADSGDWVERGQVLLGLDTELAGHTLAQRRAELQRAREALVDARRRLEEGRELSRDRNIPESELETREAEVAMAEAEWAAASAEVKYQAAAVERHELRAPFAGVISRREADIGEWVSPGTTVFELVAIDSLRFDFRAAQELFPHVNRGTAVTIRLDALPQLTIDGRISAIVPVSDPGARTFLLRAVPESETPPPMTPGMSAHALLAIDTGRSGVVVPRDALLRYPDGRVSVWVLDRSGNPPRVHERQVRLGLTFGERVEIRRGLKAGVPVVVEGNEALEDGQAVHVRSGGG